MKTDCNAAFALNWLPLFAIDQPTHREVKDDGVFSFSSCNASTEHQNKTWFSFLILRLFKDQLAMHVFQEVLIDIAGTHALVEKGTFVDAYS